MISLCPSPTSTSTRLKVCSVAKQESQSVKSVLPLTGLSHLVVHAVEQSRHHGEDGRPQGLHVVWKEADVALIEADPPSVAVHHRLQRHTRMLSSVLHRSPHGGS